MCIRDRSILGYITGHEGKGSILSFLKRKNYATTLTTNIHQTTNTYGFFSLRIDLTQKGLENHRNIIKTVLSYIKHSRNIDYPENVFEHLKTMSSLDDIFTNKGEGMWRATSLS